MSFILDFFRNMIARSPTRLIGYGSTLAVLAATFAASKLGFTLSPELLTAVGLFGAAVVTEAIRQFVYSPHTTQAIANNAAATGDTDIGTPPSGL